MNPIARSQIRKHQRVINQWERRPKIMTVAFLITAFANIVKVKQAWEKWSATQRGKES